MMNENMVKKLEMRKAVLKERIAKIDSEIQVISARKRQILKESGEWYHEEWISLSDEVWSLNSKRCDMRFELEDIEYALNPRPYRHSSSQVGCIYNSGDLDFDSEIQVKGIVLGVKL